MSIDEKDLWESHRDLALELYALGARAQLILGNVTESERYCSVILNQQNITPLEKCPIYNVKLDLVHNAGQMKKGLDICLHYLEELGCVFPKNRLAQKLKVGPYIADTKSRYLPSQEAIRSMKMIEDPVILETLRLLERAGSTAYVFSLVDLYIL